MVVAVLALAGSAAIGAFAYRGVVLPMLPPISKAENAPANNGANYGDARPSNSSQTSAGSFKKVVSREEQPIEMQVSPKVISTIPISPHQNAIRSDVLASVAAAPFAAAPSDTPGLRPIAWATSPIVDQPLSLAPGAQDHAAASPSPSPLPAGTGTAPERSFYAVQLASERSAADAHAVFRKLQAKFPNQLAGRLPIVRRADLDGEGVYYRAMVGPFASMKEADVLCSSLKAAGGSCGVERD
jgi:cell division septation protein DedD